MNLDMRFDGFAVEFFEYFIEYGIAKLIAVYFYEQAERFVVLKNWDGLVVEFFDSSAKDVQVLVVFAVATVA